MRIPYDSLTLRAVTQEIRDRLTGAVVQRVTQPDPLDLILNLWQSGPQHRGGDYKLLLSCSADLARVHLTTIKRPNPDTPPAFCMICRKYLEGARLRDVRQRDFDRILDLHFEATDGQRLIFTAELMGRHSNLILMTEAGRILDAAKRITPKQSRFRQIHPGAQYVPPPVQESKDDPFVMSSADFESMVAALPVDTEARAAALIKRIQGLSPFLAAELAIRSIHCPAQEAWDEIFGAAQRDQWMPVVVRDANAESAGAYPFPTVQFPADSQHTRDSISIALDNHFSSAIARSNKDDAARTLLGAIDSAIRAKEKRRDSLLRSLQEAGRADEHRRNGELIFANLAAIPESAESVELADLHESGSPRTIKLDPELSAKANAEAYFRRYRKAKDGAKYHRDQLEVIEETLYRLHAERSAADELTDTHELRRKLAELQQSGVLRGDTSSESETRRPDYSGHKIRRYTTPEGWEILVGENAESNDFLTRKMAAPNDIWLHVRSNPGAHVVIRTRNKPRDIPPAVLKRAATIAAQHSPAKHSSLVPVDYTLAKFVRKPRGAKPGAVLIRNEKTLHVSPDR